MWCWCGEPDRWVAYFSTDPDLSVASILETVADRSALEQVFHDVKEVHGAGQQQLRHVWANVGAWNLIGWWHTLVELWAWDRPQSRLRDRSDSPWDKPERRPSHANRCQELRREALQEEYSSLPSVGGLRPKIRRFIQRLIAESHEADSSGKVQYGIPPAKNGDYTFLLHVLTSLKSTGKGAIILPHGVLFRGGAEAAIRREIVKRGTIKGIIGLPANLFYGTGIPACIIVLDKDHAHARKGIFMVDASKGFLKDGNKNRLRAQDIHRIVDTFTRQIEVPRYARMVPLSEISDPKNDFNLNLPRYIDSAEPEDLQDIDAHLRGGIPGSDIDDLDRYWQVFPAVRTRSSPQPGGPATPSSKCRWAKSKLRSSATPSSQRSTQV